ncbi:integrase core domain-containing protein, partial [bacterium]|nr:integrase core domain-containing protein [bacterium]
VRLDQWERYYNYHRPHGGLKGKTPYEVLRGKMTCQKNLSTEP